MTEQSRKILELAEYSPSLTKKNFENLDVETLSWHEFELGTHDENDRLLPVIEALLLANERLVTRLESEMLGIQTHRQNIDPDFFINHIAEALNSNAETMKKLGG